jgi:hypothetical protein
MQIEPPRAGWLRVLIWLSFVVLCLAAPFAPPASAQPLSGVVSLSLRAGYAGYFREATWLPIRVDIRNDGGGVNGRLVVRPETSGDAIYNTYSAPVSLAAGARQTVTLYITARIFAQSARVELIADDGAVVASERALLRGIQPGDRLHVVISDAPINAVDFTTARIAANESFQADWRVIDLPDRAAALDAVDVIAINDADTSALSSAQREALTAWVLGGGHLIVGGGANWRATTAGVRDLLPVIPTEDRAVDSLDGLAAWLRAERGLTRPTIIADGMLGANARALVTAADGAILLARRTFGGGTVDFISADLSAEPLRSWAGLGELLAQLAVSAQPQPGWANGVIDWTPAAQAVEILPGFEALPDLLPLCGFLAAYIALIGPINYFILNRINRREWAWVTIPALIAVFSVAAYGIGGALRGTEATLNQLTLVRMWANQPMARVDTLIGLLSPRRIEYDLEALGAADYSAPVLRPIPRIAQGGAGLLARDVSASIDIAQAERFAAVDFTVDASYIAGFHAAGAAPAPALTGQATFIYDALPGQQIVRGSVRNDSTLTLTDPVILARGVALRLDSPIPPGGLATFDLTLPGEGAPPAAIQMPQTARIFLRGMPTNNKQTVIDLVGVERYNPNTATWTLSSGDQALRRRLLFLTSLIDDPYGSSGRADRVYLAGWTNQTPTGFALRGADVSAQSETLLLLELLAEHAPPPGSVTVSAEQFGWVVRQQQTFGAVTPIGLVMQPGEDAVFEYTPFASAQLARVDRLTIALKEVTSGARLVPVQVWDWDVGIWEGVELVDFQTVISAPARFIGPNNAVRLRVVSDGAGGYLRAGRLVVEQSGVF